MQELRVRGHQITYGELGGVWFVSSKHETLRHHNPAIPAEQKQLTVIDLKKCCALAMPTYIGVTGGEEPVAQPRSPNMAHFPPCVLVDGQRYVVTKCTREEPDGPIYEYVLRGWGYVRKAAGVWTHWRPPPLGGIGPVLVRPEDPDLIVSPEYSDGPPPVPASYLLDNWKNHPKAIKAIRAALAGEPASIETPLGLMTIRLA